MEAKAIAKTVRIAPRKVRLVVNLIRGKKLDEAAAILKLTPHGATVAVEKVVKSAAANAVNNYQMDQSLLYVKEAFVDEGPTLKRFRARARGSGARINKRTSHITIVLEERQ